MIANVDKLLDELYEEFTYLDNQQIAMTVRKRALVKASSALCHLSNVANKGDNQLAEEFKAEKRFQAEQREKKQQAKAHPEDTCLMDLIVRGKSRYRTTVPITCELCDHVDGHEPNCTEFFK